MIRLNAHTSIEENEISFTASRSSGPGGQHVNKVNTKVTLSFDVLYSPSLTNDQKQLVLNRLSGRITKEGVLQITSQDHRSQYKNKTVVLNKFIEVMGSALYVRKKRRKTFIPLSVKMKRLESKRRRSIIKTNRKQVQY
ncbi:aminoacyl-tRNA hydrolase [candidate division KSB1 bacterium]|nr:aminoacyl-tRNA hydrolase [candidate division KSB1 bacterium]